MTRTLVHLRTLGILPAPSSAQSTTQMDKAAQLLGAEGNASRRAHRHLVDRELHRWWTEEIEWRSRTGPKRGVRAIPTGTIALPITAPARARYGRFPTTETGRADYQSARAAVISALEGSALHYRPAA